MIDQYTYQIPPGGYQALSVAGDMIAVTASTGRVVIRTDSGERMELDAGQQWRPDPKANGLREQFPGLTLNNPGSDEMTVTVAIGSGEFLDLRFTASGQIAVSDGSTGESFSDLLSEARPVTDWGLMSKISMTDGQSLQIFPQEILRRGCGLRHDGPGVLYLSGEDTQSDIGRPVYAGEVFEAPISCEVFGLAEGPLTLRRWRWRKY